MISAPTISAADDGDEGDDRQRDEAGDLPRRAARPLGRSVAAVTTPAPGRWSCSSSRRRLTRPPVAISRPTSSLSAVPAVDDRDELAAVHDADPVGQLEDLVELRRDEQDRRARVASLDRLAVDELDAADVEPARRLIEDEELRVAGRARAPRRPSAGCRPTAFRRSRRIDGVRTSNSVDALLRASADRVVVADEAAGERRGVVVVEDDVVGDREREDEPEPMAVGGDEADALLVEVARRRRGRCPRPSSVTRARRRLARSPMIASTSSSWPLPATPAMPKISPARTSKLTPWTTSWPRSSATLRSSTLSIDVGRACSRRGRRSAARRGRPSARRGPPRSSRTGMRVPTTLPRRMTVMRSAISRTSYSLWLMKMIDVPSSFVSWRRTAKISRVSCGVRTAVGSSRTRIRALAIERLEDLDALLPADRQRADLGVGIDLEAELLAELRGCASCASRRSRKIGFAIGSSPRRMFSATVRTGTSMKCWWTMLMPRSMASDGLGDRRPARRR